MKKRIASLLLVVAMLFSMTANAFAVSVPPATASGEAAVAAFQDVSADFWAYSGIRDVVSRGLYQGTSPTTFEPNKNMSRAQFVIVLARYDGRSDLENQPATTGFTDVPSDFWAAGAVAWAASNNIVLGYGGENGTNVFYPNRTISRAQIAALVYRYLSYKTDVLADGSTRTWAQMLPAVNNPVSQFSDLGTVPDVFREAVEFCRTRNLMRGYEDGSLRPNVNVTRAQVATILSRMIEVLSRVGDVTPTPVAANGINLAASSAQNGTTTFREENGKVYITATPDAGYAVESVTVTDANGNKLAVTRLANGEYVFDKPTALPVTISVIYDIDNSAYYTFTAGSNADGNSSRVTLVERLVGRTWDEIASRNADGKLTFREGYSGIQVGDRLTVTHIANTGYAFDSILIRDDNGKRVTADRRDSERTRFTLPSAIPVEIDVAFYKSGERRGSGGGSGGGGGGGYSSYYIQWAPSSNYDVTVYAASPLNTVDGLVNQNVTPLTVNTVPDASQILTPGNSYSTVSYTAFVRVQSKDGKDYQPVFMNANGATVSATRIGDGVYALSNITANITVQLTGYAAYTITKADESLDFTLSRRNAYNQDESVVNNTSAKFTMAEPWRAAEDDLIQVSLSDNLKSTVPQGSTVVVRMDGEPVTPFDLIDDQYQATFLMPAKNVEISVGFEDAAWVTVNVTGGGVVEMDGERFSGVLDTRLLSNPNASAEHELKLIPFTDWNVPTTITADTVNGSINVNDNTAKLRISNGMTINVAFDYQAAAHDYYLAVEAAPENSLESGALAFTGANKPFEMTSNLYADNGAVYLKLQGSPVAITATDKAVMTVGDAIKSQVQTATVDFESALYQGLDVNPEDIAPVMDSYRYDADETEPAFSVTMAYYAARAEVDGNPDARVIPVRFNAASELANIHLTPVFYDAEEHLTENEIDFTINMTTTYQPEGEEAATASYSYQYSAAEGETAGHGVWKDAQGVDMDHAPVVLVGEKVTIQAPSTSAHRFVAILVGERQVNFEDGKDSLEFTVTANDISDGNVNIQLAIQILGESESGVVRITPQFVNADGEEVDATSFEFEMDIEYEGEDSKHYTYVYQENTVDMWLIGIGDDAKLAEEPPAAVAGMKITAKYQDYNSYYIDKMIVGQYESADGTLFETAELDEDGQTVTVQAAYIADSVLPIQVVATRRDAVIALTPKFVDAGNQEIDAVDFEFHMSFVYPTDETPVEYRYEYSADAGYGLWYLGDEETPTLPPVAPKGTKINAWYQDGDGWCVDRIEVGQYESGNDELYAGAYLDPYDAYELIQTIEVDEKYIADYTLPVRLTVTRRATLSVEPRFFSNSDASESVSPIDFEVSLDTVTDVDGEELTQSYVYYYTVANGGSWSLIENDDVSSDVPAPAVVPGMKIKLKTPLNGDEYRIGAAYINDENKAFDLTVADPEPVEIAAEDIDAEKLTASLLLYIYRYNALDIHYDFVNENGEQVDPVNFDLTVKVECANVAEPEVYLYRYAYDSDEKYGVGLWYTENGDSVTRPIINPGDVITVSGGSYAYHIQSIATKTGEINPDEPYTVQAGDIEDCVAVLNVNIQPVQISLNIDPVIITDKDGNALEGDDAKIAFTVDVTVNDVAYRYTRLFDDNGEEVTAWSSLNDDGTVGEETSAPTVRPGDTVSATKTDGDNYTMGIFYEGNLPDDLRGAISVSDLTNLQTVTITEDDLTNYAADGVISLFVRVVVDNDIQYVLRVMRNEYTEKFLNAGGEITFTVSESIEDTTGKTYNLPDDPFVTLDDYWQIPADTLGKVSSVAYKVNDENSDYAFKSMSVFNSSPDGYASYEEPEHFFYAAQNYTLDDDNSSLRVITLNSLFAAKQSQINVLSSSYSYADEDRGSGVYADDEVNFTFDVIFKNRGNETYAYEYDAGTDVGQWKKDGSPVDICPVAVGDQISVDVHEPIGYTLEVTTLNNDNLVGTTGYTVTEEDLEIDNVFYMNVYVILTASAPTFTVTTEDVSTPPDPELGSSAIYVWAPADGADYDTASDEQIADWNNWKPTDSQSYTSKDQGYVRIVANPVEGAKVDRFVATPSVDTTMRGKDEAIPGDTGNGESRYIEFLAYDDTDIKVYYSSAELLPFALEVDPQTTGYFTVEVRQASGGTIQAGDPAGQSGKTYKYTFNGDKFDETGDTTLMFYATKPTSNRPVVEVKLTEDETEIFDLENGSALTNNGTAFEPVKKSSDLRKAGETPNYIYTDDETNDVGARTITYQIAWQEGTAELTLALREFEYEYAIQFAPVIGQNSFNGDKNNDPKIYLQSDVLKSTSNEPTTLRDAMRSIVDNGEQMGNLTDEMGNIIKGFETVPVVNETVIRSAIQDKLTTKVEETVDDMMGKFQTAREDAVSELGAQAKDTIQQMIEGASEKLPDGFSMILVGSEDFEIDYDEAELDQIKKDIANGVVLKTLNKEAYTENEWALLRKYAIGETLSDQENADLQDLLNSKPVADNLTDSLNISFEMDNSYEDELATISVKVSPILARITANVNASLTFDVSEATLKYYVVNDATNHIIGEDGSDLGEYTPDTTATPRETKIEGVKDQTFDINLGASRLINVESDEPINLSNLLATDPENADSGDLIGRLNRIFNNRIDEDGSRYLDADTADAYKALYDPNGGDAFVTISFDSLEDSDKQFAQDITLDNYNFVSVNDAGEIEVSLVADEWKEIYQTGVDRVHDLRAALRGYYSNLDEYYPDEHYYENWMEGIWDNNIAKAGQFVNTDRDHFVTAFDGEDLPLNKLFRALYTGDGKDKDDIAMTGYDQAVLIQGSRAFNPEGQIGEALSNLFGGNDAYVRWVISRRPVTAAEN